MENIKTADYRRIRLCYAQTSLANTPVPHERIADTVLTVSHQSMGFGGEMVRMQMGTTFFREEFDYYEFLLEYGGKSLGYPYDFEGRGLPRRSEGFGEILEEINTIEIAGDSEIYWCYPQNDGQREITGRFSLEGFGDTYNAIRDVCPILSDTASPAPVYVSEVRLEGGSPPQLDESMSDDDSET